MKIISCEVKVLKSPYEDLVGKRVVVENEEFIVVKRKGKKRRYKLDFEKWDLLLDNLTMQVKF